MSGLHHRETSCCNTDPGGQRTAFQLVLIKPSPTTTTDIEPVVARDDVRVQFVGRVYGIAAILPERQALADVAIAIVSIDETNTRRECPGAAFPASFGIMASSDALPPSSAFNRINILAPRYRTSRSGHRKCRSPRRLSCVPGGLSMLDGHAVESRCLPRHRGRIYSPGRPRDAGSQLLARTWAAGRVPRQYMTS